jgi:hypothetical protein
MNVLILTPDRVGSTLLQRLITIYMMFRGFDRPVINLHELTNGLMAYHSDVFNREVLGKPPQDWGYYQSLPEIVALLRQCDHFKTSRLAHYHIQRRGDSQRDQLEFYQYLNQEFFIIGARRSNLFEHALSWCIYTASRQLNVYTAEEKARVFHDLYQHGIRVDRENMLKYLDAYVDYIAWSQRHFDISCYFDYEQHLCDIEKFILDLPMFHGNRHRLTWQQQFGITWQDWNRCHYLINDTSLLTHEKTPLLGHDKSLSRDIYGRLPALDQSFVQARGVAYTQSRRAIQELVDNKILVTSVPIKLQTLREKRSMILNWEECICWYNEWAEQSRHGKPYTDTTDQEQRLYHAIACETDTL